MTSQAHSESDEELAKRVQGGDHDSFGVLVERFEKKLMRYGSKFLADQDDVKDLVQDVFISVYQNIRSFDLSQRFSPWIYRVAHNTFVSGIRKHSRNPLLLLDFDALVAHVVYEDPAEAEREQKEMRALIERGLENVSPKYREVLVLYYLEEMPYKDIADIIQVPTGTVSVRLRRAKEALRAVYNDMQITYGT